MVTITVDGDALEIAMVGRHKLWAMQSSLRVPLSDIREVRRDAERARRFMPGLKLPGTHIPFVYTAGTFYQMDFRPDFWSVRNPENALVIQCSSEAAYDEVIVEVEDPIETLERIQAVLPKRA